MQKIAPNHFWFEGRRRLIDTILSKSLDTTAECAVDLGCGAGDGLVEWKKYANQVIGIDGHAELIAGAHLDPAVTTIAADVTDLPLADESADLVLALDVLEHVPDAQTLSEAQRILRPGGTILVAVPAFQWLWSYRDEDAGHLRRYTRRSIQKQVEGAGLIVEATWWYQFFLFPLVVATRFLGKFGPRMRDLEDSPRGGLNKLLLGANLFEVKLATLGVKMPIGSSIFVVARKTDGEANANTM